MKSNIKKLKQLLKKRDRRKMNNPRINENIKKPVEKVV